MFERTVAIAGLCVTWSAAWSVSYPVPVEAAAFPITVIVVRHAEEAAGNRGLTDAGRERADALASALGDSGITAIYTTETTAARSTADPVARRLRAPIHARIGTGRVREVVQAVYAGPDRAVLLVTDRDSIPELIRAFGGGSMPPISAAEFDNLYLLTISQRGKASTLRMHFGAPTEGKRSTLSRGGSRMQIHFERSGGPIPLVISGTTKLDGDSGTVASADGKYHRDLSADETRQLREMLDVDSFFKLKTELRSSSGGAAGLYQCELTVTLDDGRKHTIRASDQMKSELERLSPGLGNLVEWMAKESQAILIDRARQP